MFFSMMLKIPLLKESQRSWTWLVELTISSESVVDSLKMLSQLALENIKNFLGFCLIYFGIISMSVTTMA